MSKNVLSSKQRFAFWNFVQAEFTKSGMTNVDFAKHASDTLGFVTTKAHLEAALNGLEIPTNSAAEANPALLRRLEAAEAALALHEKAFEGLYRHLGWRPAKESS